MAVGPKDAESFNANGVDALESTFDAMLLTLPKAKKNEDRVMTTHGHANEADLRELKARYVKAGWGYVDISRMILISPAVNTCNISLTVRRKA